MVWWGYLGLGAVLTWLLNLLQGLLNQYFPAIPVWVEAPLLFFLVKLVGDILIYLLWYNYWWLFLRPGRWDILWFPFLGLVAAGALEVAIPLVGGEAGLAVPGALSYLLFLPLTERERRRHR